VTGTEETEGVGEAHVEERSHLCSAAIEQASSIIFYLGVMEGPKLKLKTDSESLNGEHIDFRVRVTEHGSHNLEFERLSLFSHPAWYSSPWREL